LSGGLRRAEAAGARPGRSQRSPSMRSCSQSTPSITSAITAGVSACLRAVSFRIISAPRWRTDCWR